MARLPIAYRWWPAGTTWCGLIGHARLGRGEMGRQLGLPVIGTVTFATVILGVTAEKHSTAFAGLGLTLAGLRHHPGDRHVAQPGPIGPALFSGAAAIGQLWLFIVAPLIGGAIAGVVAKARVFEMD
ncbi:hypothetical protein ACFSQT_36210 [Mesorhizobium calcicola]|uniref:HPP family protein n=1 Tax=Mesorhizobium calcicola TaxID=1300310 RepID=A0ABW4WQV9_9HYPH